MVEEHSVDGLSLSDKTAETPSSEQLRSALAETRASIGHRLVAIEDEVQRRVIDTVDQVNHRITQTTQHISEKITQPIENMERRVKKVRQQVRQEPIKSLVYALGVGIFCGAILGFRRRRPRMLLLAEPTAEQTRAQVHSSAPRSTFLQEITASLGHQIIHQVIQLSFNEISRRRSNTL